MKYSDVVDIPAPLEEVKQVRDSATVDAARIDVETYVISERMATQLAEVVLPNLRVDVPSNNKGIFIVGTYGTGKTHLMSVVAAVAEFPDVLEGLRHKGLIETLGPVSGAFQVVRFDIGASAMSLRDIVCAELAKGLATRGVDYTFPPIEQVTNTKDSLVEMMAAFEAVHPDQGLLFVLHEMLDYLRGRRDAELIQDLAFLREVGETCKNTRFRMIGGLQESPDPKKAADLEKLRRRSLLREFECYLSGSGKLTRFRSEAVRAGFDDAWDRREFELIAKVGKRLPADVLVEDPTLRYFVDNAEKLVAG